MARGVAWLFLFALSPLLPFIRVEASPAAYFAGVRSIQAANGEHATAEAAACVRFAPDDSAIIEQFVTSPFGDQPAERALTFTVSGSHFHIRDRDNLITGSGNLHGDPWRWSGWNVTAQLPGGLSVAITESLMADSLISRQSVYTPNHQLIATIVDRLGRSDSAHFEAGQASPVWTHGLLGDDNGR